MSKRWTAAIPVLTVALFAFPDGESPSPDGDALQRARLAADALGSQLTAALMREMGKGGPLQAVQVCSEQAHELAAEQSGDGMTVRRVSLQPRNPADAPDGYEREKLLQLATARGEGELPLEVYEEITRDGVRQLRHLRPLTIRSRCLVCHGDPEQMVPEIRALLQELYPEDRAVGYEEGDLRGAISITVPLD